MVQHNDRLKGFPFGLILPIVVMMKCDECGQEDSLFYIQQEGQPDQRVLCRACAARLGYADGVQGLGARFDLLFADTERSGAGETERVCPVCGLTLSGFRENGRLGCARCAVVFRRELAHAWRRAGRSQGYSGKVPLGASVEPSPEAIRAALDVAVRDEDFERAAALRDRLKRLEART